MTKAIRKCQYHPNNKTRKKSKPTIGIIYKF